MIRRTCRGFIAVAAMAALSIGSAATSAVQARGFVAFGFPAFFGPPVYYPPPPVYYPPPAYYPAYYYYPRRAYVRHRRHVVRHRTCVCTPCCW